MQSGAHDRNRQHDCGRELDVAQIVCTIDSKELEAFLKTGDSESTGWSKDDGSGESIGHESGRKIVKILQSNPDKVGKVLWSV